MILKTYFNNKMFLLSSVVVLLMPKMKRAEAISATHRSNS